ncbi:MAG: putative nucleic acid-binding protein [Candidatus Promineifilaceae bacterium]|jgi:predicted nucleic acid-binding protein
MTLIDSSAWIHSLRPRGDAAVTKRVRVLLETGEAAWCPMIRLELWNGARGEHEKRVLRDMQRDLPELDVNPAVWTAAYELARKARQRGVTVPATDLLVAACARHHGVNIEHDDEHLAALTAL